MNSLSSSFSATFRVSSSRQQQQRLHLNLIARIPTMSIEELFIGDVMVLFQLTQQLITRQSSASARHRIKAQNRWWRREEEDEARYQLWLNKVKCWSLVFDRGEYFEWPWTTSHIELRAAAADDDVSRYWTADCLWLAVDPRNNAALRCSRLGNEYFSIAAADSEQ